jgi:prepilin-type N-terminal cleavage/methylation domain-containing protein
MKDKRGQNLTLVYELLYFSAMSHRIEFFHMSRRLQTIRGFTLVETMIVVAIIGLLVMVAVPNFFRFVHKYKLKAAVGELHGNLGLARMAATNQNTTVTVTVCNKGVSCPLSPAPSILAPYTPTAVTVFLRTVGGADVVPPMILDSELALTNVSAADGVGAQDLQFNNRGFWVNTGTGTNLCINNTGVGTACPGSGQALNFKNTDGLNYRIVVATTGKTSWCYSANCAQ